MQGKSTEEIINELLSTLTIDIEPELTEKYEIQVGEDDNKALKKRFKKLMVDQNDSSDKAIEKMTKMVDQMGKYYEAAGKQVFKTRQSYSSVKVGEAEKDKANKQKVMFENLFNVFKKKYDEQIKNASKVEQEEEDKRKLKIQELQERIKAIQSQYEEAGKVKVEKFKENQMLKHELSKYEPHLIASESLAEAQLKKKSIQIEIQMTTLKQKIEMMNSFKSMREETEKKMKSGRQLDEKLEKRLKVANEKEDEHKMSLAKAHLIFEDYKKAFNVLKVQLPQKEKDAFMAKDKVKKIVKSLDEIKNKNQALDKDYQTHADQIDVLKKLEQQIQAQLAE